MRNCVNLINSKVDARRNKILPIMLEVIDIKAPFVYPVCQVRVTRYISFQSVEKKTCLRGEVRVGWLSQTFHLTPFCIGPIHDLVPLPPTVKIAVRTKATDPS